MSPSVRSGGNEEYKVQRPVQDPWRVFHCSEKEGGRLRWSRAGELGEIEEEREHSTWWCSSVILIGQRG